MFLGIFFLFLKNSFVSVKKILLKFYEVDFQKWNFSKFFGLLRIFFCFTICKKLNKSCSLDKNFLFLKKKVVSLKKTKICCIFKTNWEIVLPVHSPNLYGISIWKMHGRSHGHFFICFGDFHQQWYGIFHSILTTDFQFVNTSFLLYCGANTLLKFIYLAKNATKFKTKRNIFKSLQYFRNSFFEFWLINAVKGTSPTI